MKIDEGCINHNAVRMIKDLVDTRYDLIASGYDADTLDSERGFLLMTLGEIGGIIDMAEAMKEVLKA